MRVRPIHRLAAKLAFIIGFSFMLLGVVILMGTIAGAPHRAVLPASLSIIVGFLFAVFAVRLNRNPRYIFVSAFFIQTGMLLLFVALGTIKEPLSRLWPFVSVFAGLALLPAGWFRYERPKSVFIVPAIAFVALGAALLFFSFRLVPFSFKRFVLEWWPQLLVLSGVILVLISLSSRKDGEEPGP
jgi:hypothetical protein